MKKVFKWIGKLFKWYAITDFVCLAIVGICTVAKETNDHDSDTIYQVVSRVFINSIDNIKSIFS